MTDAIAKSSSPRRSVLDLAPLELDCMNTLWPMGEGTVREIRDGLAVRRPRAYTTIMTIMDRLARKGVVERRKIGRAYTYRANVTADEARAQALGQVVENFFGGSKEALIAQLNGVLPAARLDPAYPQAPRARAAAASSRGVTTSPDAIAASALPSRPPAVAIPSPSAERTSARKTRSANGSDIERMDDTLL
ncbi:MAG: BlaI/MecI/CopY family transcriptional regulator [Candidatus Acidiferrales bacterium]